jgi:hypothetical protein
MRSTIQGMTTLGIKHEPMAPGSVEMAFLIPRLIFDNHLGQFAKELKFINQLISHFSEAITGTAEAVELQNLSSSVPTVTIAAAAAVMLAIGNVVDKFLAAWKKIEEIREIRGRLTAIGMKGTAVEELTTQITTIVDEVVEESTEVVIAHYTSDPGRRNELKNALNGDTLRLFGQIERGLTIEIRADAPKSGPEDEDHKAFESLATLSRNLQFPQITGEPILLTSGEVVEGPAVKATKKTTSHKTLTKKETKESVKAGSIGFASGFSHSRSPSLEQQDIICHLVGSGEWMCMILRWFPTNRPVIAMVAIMD